MASKSAAAKDNSNQPIRDPVKLTGGIEIAMYLKQAKDQGILFAIIKHWDFYSKYNMMITWDDNMWWLFSEESVKKSQLATKSAADIEHLNQLIRNPATLTGGMEIIMGQLTGKKFIGNEEGQKDFLKLQSQAG